MTRAEERDKALCAEHRELYGEKLALADLLAFFRRRPDLAEEFNDVLQQTGKEYGTVLFQLSVVEARLDGGGQVSTTVEVVAIKPLANGDNLRAFASVRIGDVTVHDCRIVQQPGQRAWLSLPQREYQQDGQKKYAAIVELSEALKREVSRAVLSAWEQEGWNA